MCDCYELTHLELALVTSQNFNLFSLTKCETESQHYNSIEKLKVTSIFF